MTDITTVIFDLDGTLLYTLADLADAVNFGLSQYGYPERELEEIRHFVGNGVRNLMERSIPGGLQNPDFENCLDAFIEYYAEHMQDKTRPYEGIPELLEALRGGGYKTAIVSNKLDRAVKALSDQYFGASIGLAAGEVEGVKRKPAPDCVFRILRELGSDAKQAIYVGDSDVDVFTAHNAGVPCVGVTWGFRSREVLAEAGADFLIDHPMELMDILRKTQSEG